MLCSGSSLSAIPSAPGSGKGYSLPSRSVFLVGLPRGFGARLSGQLTRLGYLLEKAIAISQNRIVVEGEFFCSRMSPPPNSCGAGLGPHSVGNLHDQDPTLHSQDEDFSWNDENWQSIRNQAMPHCGAWSTNFGHTVHQRLAQTVSRAPRATFPSFLVEAAGRLAPGHEFSDTRQRETENGGLRTMA